MEKVNMHELLLRKSFAKTCLTMKFILLFLLAFVAQLSAGVYGQVGKVTLQMEDATFEEVMRALENTTGYTFVYEDRQVAGIRNLDLNYTDTEIREVLNACLAGTGLTYRLVDNVIVIQAGAKAPADTLKGQNLKGTVKDEKKVPLPGVTIQVRGTSIGFVTDMDGKFDIDLPQRDSLELMFSFVGYKTEHVKVRPDMKTLDVVMKKDVVNIDEVVVTGIFNKPKESFTGAVTTITRKEIKMFKGANMLQTLRNIDPAFNIVQNNAYGSDPNYLPEVNLRGSSSLPTSIAALNQGAQAQLNTPLIIMDGFEISLQELMDFNDEDIESINILKDASATAIYGSRGANGVIVITTRVPEEGNLKFRIQGGINLEIPDLTSYDVLNAAEKLEFEREMGLYTSTNNGENLRLQQLYNELLLEIQNGVDTYWLSQPLRMGVGQNYNLNLDGGSKEFRWAVSLGFNQTIGVMKESKRDNFSGSITLTYSLKKLLFRNQVRFTNNVGNDTKYGSFSEYVQMNPYWRPYDENGKPIKNYLTANNKFVANPLYNASLNSFQNNKNTQVSNNFSLEWLLLEGLKVNVRLGVAKGLTENNNFRSPQNTFFDYYEGADYFRKGTYMLATGRNWSWDANFTMSYSRVFKESHQLYCGIDVSASESNSYSCES